MKKRASVLFLAAAMVLAAFSGCSDNGTTSNAASTGDTASTASTEQGGEESQAEENGEVVELEFWGWWSSEARKPVITEMVENYNASQSKYHVTYVDIPWGDIFTKNIAQIAAGNPCDVMANSMEEVRFRASEDQVESLDAYVTDEEKAGFYEQYIDACTGDDGSLYAIPYSVDTRAIYYNKDQFAEVGIDPESIVTWDDLTEAAYQLDVKDGDTYTRVGFMPLLGNGGVDT